MRKSIGYTLQFTSLGLMLALVGCQQNGQGAAPGGGAAGMMQMPPAKVDVVTIAPQSLAITDTSSGRVAAFREAEVRPQISGIIQKQLFEGGSSVKQGELLYQVDATVYQAELASARAQLQVAMANVESARSKASRYANLSRNAAVSQQDVDDANAAVKVNEAQIEAARAAVKRAQINLDYTRIEAPISGVISRSAVSEGALVSAQQAAPLATIRQLEPVYVDIKRPAEAAMRARQNGSSEQAVTLKLESGSDFAETGQLQFSESSVDVSTGMVNARAVFDNKDGLLLPGMYVRASIVSETLDNAILAPQQAIQRRPDGSTLAMLVNADNVVEARPVSVGRTVDDQWLVTGGLAAGDRVIVTGLQKIKPGDSVEPVDKAAAAAAQ